MIKWLREKSENRKAVLKVAEKQLRANRTAIESLRDYDIGKKDISTDNVERRLGDIRVAPQK